MTNRIQKQQGSTGEPEPRIGYLAAVARGVEGCPGDGGRLGDTAPAENKRTLGEMLRESANLDIRFSPEQAELSRLELKSHPRLIRGVAGSGKTVVLSAMAAHHLHHRVGAGALFPGQHGPQRVAVVCFNRALVPFIRARIDEAYRREVHAAVPGGVLQVIHLNGLVYHISRTTDERVRYIPAEGDRSPRALHYLDMLERLERENGDLFRRQQYDAMLVDEGQDIEPTEFMLLHKLVKADPATGEKNLVIYYDDAQNVYAKNRPLWKEMGINVQHGDRSRVMKQCFRNTREVLELGFNVLLGKQAPDGHLARTATFADLKMLRENDLVEESEAFFRVRFTERTGSKPLVIPFASREQEKQWVASEVVRSIVEEGVRPQDIMVLFDREADFGDLDQLIRRLDQGRVIRGFVKPYNRNRADQDRYILQENHITISTTRGAKGYDAGLVFLVGADLFGRDPVGRASFYIGATRAKLALRVSGVQPGENLMAEALRLSAVL
jgi:superfamily I DNA and RNA helicase